MEQVRELKAAYFEQFQCIGGACEDTCCADWKITIDKKTYQKYKNEKHPDLKLRLKENISRNRKNQSDYDYGQFKLNDHGACSMLSDDGLCTIHTVNGGESLCHTCQVYPRNFQMINNTLEKSLDVSCPEAARLILLNKDGIDFIEDYTANTQLNTLFTNHKDAKTEAFFWTNRMFFIRVLQHRKYSIETRMMVIGLYIKKLETFTVEERFKQSELLAQKYANLLDADDTASLFETIKPKFETQFALFTNLIQDYAFSKKRFKQLIDIAYKQLAVENTLEVFTKIIQQNKNAYLNNNNLTIAFENYLVNLTFTKYDESKLTFIEFYSFLSIQFTLIRLLTLGLVNEVELSDEMIVQIFQSFEKSCAHNLNYISASQEIISKPQFTKAAQAIQVIAL